MIFLVIPLGLLLVVGLMYGFVGFMLVLVFVVGLWEKRMVWPYQLASSSTPLLPDADGLSDTIFSSTASQRPRATGYTVRALEQAADLGFTMLGSGQDVRGGIYQMHYQFLLSPDRDVLALIGDGTMLKLEQRTNWLYSRLTDGRFLTSLDNERGAHLDLSNRTIEGLKPGADFATLLDWHYERIAYLDDAIKPFLDRDPLAVLRQFRAERVDLLEAAGLMTYIDSERNRHRFTIRGSAISTYMSHRRGVHRRLNPDSTWASA